MKMLTQTSLDPAIPPDVDSPSPPGPEQPEPTATIALLPWGDLWEDFLDSIDVSLETFCTDGPGGWLLGYMEALQSVGIRTVLILISARVSAPQRFHHAATGATITVLPTPKAYRALRQSQLPLNPYIEPYIESAAALLEVKGIRRAWRQAQTQIAPYLSTPMGLLAAELRREHCQAILCQEHEYTRFDSCVWLGQRLGLPVFTSFQGGTFDPNPIGRWLRPFTLRACAGLCIGPKTERDRVQARYRLPAHRIAPIFNPIDLKLWYPGDRAAARRSLGIPSTAQVVVWHGRIEFATKRLDILLDAWERLGSARPGRELQLLLLGTGQDADRLHQRLADLPQANVLWINDYVTDRPRIRQFLAAGDVYAFPSEREGFPVSPIEAMACGLPVVAAAASGVPDIFTDGADSGGLLVPCGDVAAFTVALGRILDDPDWGRQLGERARQRVEAAFSTAAVGQQLRHFFGQSGLRLPQED